MRGEPCSVAALFEHLPPEQSVEFQNLLDDRSWSGARIWRHMTDRGHNLGQQTINRHRAGSCRCARPELPRIDTTGKILVLDIERLPGLGYLWEPKTRYVPPDRWIEWPRLVCFAARWYDDKKPIFEAEWIDRERMVQRSWELYDQADAVVTYNGIRFDDKHLRSEWLLAGMPPPRPWKPIDLYRQIQPFGFESKSLDSVSRRLGRPGKIHHYDIGQAFAAVNGNPAAQRAFRRYNIGDVELTDWLYDRLRGWMPRHPHLGRSTEKTCNQCERVLTLDDKQPTNYRAVVIDYDLYRCPGCGGNVRGGWHARAAQTRGAA